MIDEKKIEETAKEYAWNNRSDEGGEEDMLDKKRAFKSGIHWLYNNLWHPASEIPEPDKWILYEYDYHGEPAYDTVRIYPPHATKRWILFIPHNCTRWLYIDDLLKGSK